MARVAPITPLKIGANGAFLAVRSSSAQGSCGVHGYPCQHPGVDVVGAQGTVVRAPEAGVVTTVATGAAAPYVGYGPWLVVIRGDESGKYHLLGHLEPAANLVTVGQRVTLGQPVGATSSANHTHWEMRKQPVPPAGQTNSDNNEDPVAWLAGTTIVTLALVGLLGWGAYRLWSRA